MNKVTKRMTTIAVIVMFAVIIAVGVTFVSAQKQDKSSLLARNIVALAQNEGVTYGWCACPVSGTTPGAIFEGRMFCTKPCELNMIYSCPKSSTNNFYLEGSQDRCTN
jgi:hypothetical protein